MLQAASAAPAIECEDELDDESGVSSADLAITVRVLHQYARNIEAFKHPHCKALRVAIAPLMAVQLAKPAVPLHVAVPASVSAPVPSSSLVGRASDALRYGRWTEAVSLLRALAIAGISPKLGSAQRWVRDADACREAVPGPRWRALAAVIHACAPVGVVGTPLDYASATVGVQGVLTLRRFPPICADPAPPVPGAIAVPTDSHQQEQQDILPPSTTAAPSGFTVVSFTRAASRVPPNRFDQTIYAGAATVLDGGCEARVTAVQVQGIPGATLMSSVLSRRECAEIGEEIILNGF